MAGLVPAIHVLLPDISEKQGVDARNESGHDERSKAWMPGTSPGMTKADDGNGGYGHTPVRSPSMVTRELMLWPPIATLVVTSAV